VKIIDVFYSFFKDSVSSASPHAIAFLAGYSADVLFSLLDKAVVAALRPIQPHTCTADISYGEGLRLCPLCTYFVVLSVIPFRRVECLSQGGFSPIKNYLADMSRVAGIRRATNTTIRFNVADNWPTASGKACRIMFWRIDTGHHRLSP
jgi:hypothetical protein